MALSEGIVLRLRFEESRATLAAILAPATHLCEGPTNKLDAGQSR